MSLDNSIQDPSAAMGAPQTPSPEKAQRWNQVNGAFQIKSIQYVGPKNNYEKTNRISLPKNQREKQERLTMDSNFLTVKSYEQRLNTKSQKKIQTLMLSLTYSVSENEFQRSFVRYVVPGFSEESQRKTKEASVAARKKRKKIVDHELDYQHENDMSSCAVDYFEIPLTSRGET